MTIVADTILGVIYVAAGTVYTVTPQITRNINATGSPGFIAHPFDHPFLLMAFEFVAQALCIPLWLIITGGVTLPRNQHGVRLEPDGAAPRYDMVDPADGEDDELLLQPDAGDDDEGEEGGEGDDEIIGADDEVPEGHLRLPVQPNNPAWNHPPVDQTKFNKFLFVVPAFFDLSRYGLMYVALKLTYDSSYMLTRSAAVLFTVLLRVAFLSKHMAKYMWVSIAMVVIGIGLIGMTDFLPMFSPSGFDKYGIAAGCLLMVMSQIMIAMQIVYEEKFMDKHSIHPLRVVGLEGCFGSVVAVVLLLPFTYIKAGFFSDLPLLHLVDAKDAFLQMKSSWILSLCVVGRVVSKVVYYYTGTTFVRNQHDAAKRITIDVHHDLIIWGISLAVHWQKYFYPQIVGFVLVFIGMVVYCDIIPLPKVCLPPAIPPAAGLLLPEEREMQNATDHQGDAGEGEGEGDGRDNDRPVPGGEGRREPEV